MTDDEFAEIEAAHAACKGAVAAVDPDAYFYANERFHFAIYSARTMCSCRSRLRRCRENCAPIDDCKLGVRNRTERSHGEHQAIVDALRNGDAEQAMHSVRRR
jgi:DNA-binding GntR family transcriptional regulator